MRARPQNMSIYGDLSERRAPIGPAGRGTWGSAPGTAPHPHRPQRPRPRLPAPETPGPETLRRPACGRGAPAPGACGRVAGRIVRPTSRPRPGTAAHHGGGPGCTPKLPGPGLGRVPSRGVSLRLNLFWGDFASRAPPASSSPNLRREPSGGFWRRPGGGVGGGPCDCPNVTLPWGTLWSCDLAPVTLERNRRSHRAAATSPVPPPEEGAPCSGSLAAQTEAWYRPHPVHPAPQTAVPIVPRRGLQAGFEAFPSPYSLRREWGFV